MYASPEQRVAGGGCLDLTRMVEEELGLEAGAITGIWDFAHNMQIVWKNSLGEHEAVEELIELIFQTMDDYRVGQSSTKFRAKAAELSHLVLNNKKRQTTRFVRSFARGLQAWFRNLPTLIALKAEKYEMAVREGRNTEAREVLATLSKLRDPRNLLLAAGMGQLVEYYVRASVEAQHTYRFPTQAWSVVLEMREKVEALGEEWRWGEEELEFTGLEAPAKVKQRLLEEGTYVPMVKKGSVEAANRRGADLKEMGLLEEGGCVDDLYSEEGDSTVPLAGEAVMEVPLDWRRARRRGLFSAEDGRGGDTRELTIEDVARVEETLGDLAKTIKETWDERQQQTNLEKASYAVFAEKFDWGEDTMKVTQGGEQTHVCIENAIKMRDLLIRLLDELPKSYSEMFVPVEVVDGYASYLKFCARELDSMLQDEHELYERWYKVGRLTFLVVYPICPGICSKIGQSHTVRSPIPESPDTLCIGGD